MRKSKLHLLPLAESLLFGVTVHANESTKAPDTRATSAVYEGVDARGKVVRVTSPDLRVERFVRVSPPLSGHYPKLHWSARFGTGTAADFES